jgi:small multidrug resistance pump
MNALAGSMFVTAVALSLVLTTAHALLKWASQQPHVTFADLLMTHGVVVAAALALYGAVFLGYLYALRQFEMSELFPLYTGLTLILVACVGVVMFGERLSLQQIGGIAAIIAGLVMLQLGGA